MGRRRRRSGQKINNPIILCELVFADTLRTHTRRTAILILSFINFIIHPSTIHHYSLVSMPPSNAAPFATALTVGEGSGMVVASLYSAAPTRASPSSSLVSSMVARLHFICSNSSSVESGVMPSTSCRCGIGLVVGGVGRGIGLGTGKCPDDINFLPMSRLQK